MSRQLILYYFRNLWAS